jgi:hypothetical protein
VTAMALLTLPMATTQMLLSLSSRLATISHEGMTPIGPDHLHGVSTARINCMQC